MLRMAGEAETKTSQSHTLTWWIKMRRDISAAEIPTEECKVPDQHQATHLKVPVLGREVTSGCEITHNFWLRKPVKTMAEIKHFWSPRRSSSRARAWTYSDGDSLNSSSKSTREELNGLALGEGRRGGFFPTHKCWQRPLFLCWTLSPQSQQVPYLRLHHLANTVIPWDPTPPNLLSTPVASSGLSIRTAGLGPC